MWSNLDLSAGVYYRTQNDYLPAPAVCTGTGASISSSKCAGGGRVSFLIDYKPIKRVDVYGGVMVSNVWGGFANGHLYTQNVDPTVGLRIPVMKTIGAGGQLGKRGTRAPATTI